MKNTKNTPKAAKLNPATIRRKAFAAKDAALKADATKFAKGMICAVNLLKLDAMRAAGEIVDAEGRKLSQKAFVSWLNGDRQKGDRIELAMFKRYVRAARFTPAQVKEYLDAIAGKAGTHDKGASVTGLVNYFKESKETEETLSTLTAGDSRLTCKGDAKNRTYSFKGELSALEAEATKLLAAIARLKKESAKRDNLNGAGSRRPPFYPMPKNYVRSLHNAK